MQYEIIKFDNLGRGITYVNGVITFVSNTIIGDIVTLNLVKETKKYNEAKVVNYCLRGPKYIDYKCPLSNLCGGCQLANISYQEQLDYKVDRVIRLFSKYASTTVNPEIISCDEVLNYRNKITLKVVNHKIGYFKDSSHELVEINNCYIVSNAINDFLKDITKCNINNGEIVIRSNYNNELLIWIKSDDKISIPDLKDKKIVGIVVNDKTIKGENFFLDKINDLWFNVSYNSFFQVNRNINSKLFNLVTSFLEKTDNVLDLYCGVGTLSINAAQKANKVLGIEIVENAIKNALINKKINKCDNVEFICGDVKKAITKIKMDYNTVIIDPPRSGIDKDSLNLIIDNKFEKIIYIACDPNSLVRDYNLLKDKYDLDKIYLLDMFPNTYHVECVCVLKLR